MLHPHIVIQRACYEGGQHSRVYFSLLPLVLIFSFQYDRPPLSVSPNGLTTTSLLIVLLRHSHGLLNAAYLPHLLLIHQNILKTQKGSYELLSARATLMKLLQEPLSLINMRDNMLNLVPSKTLTLFIVQLCTQTI
jgi:hypothetical protein